MSAKRLALFMSFATATTLLPSAVLAQGGVTTEEPPRVQEIQAVERGFYLEAQGGLGWLVNKIDNRSYGMSLLVGTFAGYDILPILSFQVGAYAFSGSVRVPDERDNPPYGDLLYLIPMGQLQFALITTERNFLWVRGGAGFAFGLPEEINGVPYSENGPAFSGSVGFEHFTKLRHFSIGVHAGVIVVTKPDVGIGVAITPTLKYTF